MTCKEDITADQTRSTINHVGCSGGKDSTAALLWAVYESGYDPATIRATFANTHNEHELTYDYVRMLSEKVHPIEWLEPAEGFYDLAKRKGRFPSRKAQFCTSHLKLIPTQDHILRLMMQGFNVLAHSGVRAEEGGRRATLPEREWDGFFACEVFRPLLRWTLHDVWAILKRHNIPPNPLYAYGARRVGCFPCINSSKGEIRMVAKRFPERIDMIREAERDQPNRFGGYSSFYHAKTVPERFRSGRWTDNDGKVFKIATIDDVVKWSQTTRGARSIAFDLDEDAAEDGPACNAFVGACE